MNSMDAATIVWNCTAHGARRIMLVLLDHCERNGYMIICACDKLNHFVEGFMFVYNW